MEKRTEKLITRLSTLREAFRGERWRAVRRAAEAENPWFTEEFIDRAAEAVCEEFLDREKLYSWLGKYNTSTNFHAERVGIVAAGNIPMVGFYDVLCAVAAGHSVSLKPSSKDRVLMEYLAGNIVELCDADVEIVEALDRYDIDFLIATGSDTTATHFREAFRGIPSIVRGTRHSYGLLTGGETREQLRGLRDDVFLYNGLGCRSISHLFVPVGYDLERALLPHLYPYPCKRFEEKATYERALCTMRGERFVAGDGFVMIEKSPATPAAIGTVGFSYYTDAAQVVELLRTTLKPQCTVGAPGFAEDVAFGSTQRPSLETPPDGISPLDLLLSQ